MDQNLLRGYEDSLYRLDAEFHIAGRLGALSGRVFPCMICLLLSCISQRMATCPKYAHEEGVRSGFATGEGAVPCRARQARGCQGE
ncbi:hypothetical protein PIB30_102672 [Stylosanthes scabra]|uniref:Uncharacterized protein n=1 Tax=Stylosanthes scabra TaxID=79078 RepID=A0ABU6YYJ1_9FABA|nr:hypothetical protein [Stylosanthes scabra]